MKKRSFIPVVLLTAAISLIIMSLISFDRPVQKNIGLQLFSIRDSIMRDLPGAIAKVGKMGYKYVETVGYKDGKFYEMEPDAFKALCKANGIWVLSSNTGQPLPDSAGKGKNMTWWSDCINAHVKVGAKYIVQPSMGEGAYKSLDTLKKYCNYFNMIGDMCNAKGIRFGYHNNGKEFTTKLDGHTVYDFMLENTDPSKVTFEMDLYWAVLGGVKPQDYLNKYPGRFEIWHIKDKEEVGASGMMDFASIWAASGKSGMKYGLVEIYLHKFDEFTSCKKSLDFLNAANYVVMPK
jgi:sugar phosphate isomerase/epimerase